MDASREGSPEVSAADTLRLVPLSGGDINQVYRVEPEDAAPLLFKWNARPPAGFFEAEARGLELLAQGPLVVPRVYATAGQGLLMEWLDPAPGGAAAHQATDLGAGLAGQHRVSAAQHGLEEDNFIGELPQRNSWEASWIAFYGRHRLRAQGELARQRGRWNARRERWLARLVDRLADWIDDAAVQPSLLHGDLWGGNWLATARGPAVIDPAVCYGDREMDLAMAALFGGFPRSFFAAYEDAASLPPGVQERRPLYQLYYLLVHLNVFGEGYGGHVDRILRRYGG